MNVPEMALLPFRLATAATHATLALGHLAHPEGPVRRPGGYGERLSQIFGEGGYVDRLVAALTDPSGPIGLLNGTLDRLLAADGAVIRLLQKDGAVDRLLAEGGPLERLLAAGGALDRVTQEGGVLDRLLVEEGLLDRVLTEDGFVEKLTADGGTLDQLVALGATLEGIQPRLAELAGLVPELHASVDALNRAVEPLSDLANRIPIGRRRAAIEA